MYAYVGGSPITKIDPFGEFGVPGAIAGGIFGGIGGGFGAAASRGSVGRGILVGALAGAVVGGTGSWITGSIGANVAVRVVAGALGNAVGQGQSINNPCYTGFNLGSFIGSAAGGGVSGLMSAGAWGTKFTGPMGSQIVQRAIAGIPGSGVSTSSGIVGTAMGKKTKVCGCD